MRETMSADCDKPVGGSLVNQQRLGPSGLALHYANIVIQIDTIVSALSLHMSYIYIPGTLFSFKKITFVADQEHKREEIEHVLEPLNVASQHGDSQWYLVISNEHTVQI